MVSFFRECSAIPVTTPAGSIEGFHSLVSDFRSSKRECRGVKRFERHAYEPKIVTNCDQISIFGVCKCLKTRWPGTESNRRRQPFQGCALPSQSGLTDGGQSSDQAKTPNLATPNVGSVCDERLSTA